MKTLSVDFNDNENKICNHNIKIGDYGIIIKIYNNGTYLVQFVDDGIENFNLYSKDDLKLI
jgi:hypothetical protein